MFGKKTVGWDALADSIIAACWRTDRRYVNRHSRVMLKALRASVRDKKQDKALMDNLTRLAEFCCLDGNYTKAAKIYEIILKAQEKLCGDDLSAQSNTRVELDTLARIRHLKSDWLTSQPKQIQVATEAIVINMEEHIFYLSQQAA